MTLLSAGIVGGDTVTTTTIDSFEDQNISEYNGDTTEWDVVDPSTLGTSWDAPNGTYVARNLSGQGFSRILSTSGSGLPSYFAKGNIARCYCRTTGLSGRFRAIFGVASSSPFQNYYAAVIDYANSEIRIEKMLSTGRSTIAGPVSASPSANTTGHLEITWDDGSLGGADNDITAAYVEGGTELNSVSTNDSDHAAAEGVGLNAHNNSTADIFADWYHIRNTQ